MRFEEALKNCIILCFIPKYWISHILNFNALVIIIHWYTRLNNLYFWFLYTHIRRFKLHFSYHPICKLIVCITNVILYSILIIKKCSIFNRKQLHNCFWRFQKPFLGDLGLSSLLPLDPHLLKTCITIATIAP